MSNNALYTQKFRLQTSLWYNALYYNGKNTSFSVCKHHYDKDQGNSEMFFKMKSWWRPICAKLKCRAQKQTWVAWASVDSHSGHQCNKEASDEHQQQNLRKIPYQKNLLRIDSWQNSPLNYYYLALSTNHSTSLAPSLSNEFHQQGLLLVPTRQHLKCSFWKMTS